MRVFKRGRVWYCYVYENGVRIQRSTRCHDRKAAEAIARQFERDGADPDHAAARAATLGDALTLLLRTRREQAKAGRRSEDTVSFYEAKAGHWSRLLEHDAHGKPSPFPLAQLRPRHVDDYISTRRREGAADATIHKELVTLRVALKLARRAGLWHGDPGELIPVGFGPSYKPRERALTRPEMQRLLAELLADRAARVAFIVATSACWRETELAERADVAADLATVLIRGTKRESRYRTVPIVTPEQRSLLAFAHEHAGGEGARLFAPWSNVRHDLEAACRRAKIERCSPNDLRRTFARWLRAAGAAPDLIAPAMGHVDTRMVERVYGRMTPAELANRIGMATGGGPEALLIRLVLADLEAIFALAGGPAPRREGCITGASDRVDFAGRAATLGSKTPQFTGEFVPRDGIEPPTRGFSIPAILWPNPRKELANQRSHRGGGAPVVQDAARRGRGRR